MIRLKVPPVAEARGASCAPKGSRLLNRAGTVFVVAETILDCSAATEVLVEAGAGVVEGAGVDVVAPAAVGVAA